MALETEPDNSKQCFVAVQFGDDHTEPVMMPVADLSVLEDEEEKQKIVDSAWAYFQRGEFARESINPKFIEGLASDLREALQIQDILAPLVVAGTVELYMDRLEKEVAERGESIVDSNALHLKLERSGENDLNLTFDPPDGWEEIAVDKISRLTQGLFPESGQGPLSWYKFAEWLWINQVAGSLGDLEEELGEDVLAAMSGEEFERALLNQVLEHENSVYHTGALIFRRVEHIAALMIKAIEKSVGELWMLEKLLGFRKLRPPEDRRGTVGLVVSIDFGRLLHSVCSKPEHLYQLPPRRFEELIAHLFERFGYEVELTPESRDGGYDISAVRKAETETRVLIECKRYTPPNKVGRPTVQRLMGVLGDRDVQATMGIVATTSTFTRDAKAYIDCNRGRVQGKDFSGIVRWVSDILRKTTDPRS